MADCEQTIKTPNAIGDCTTDDDVRIRRELTIKTLDAIGDCMTGDDVRVRREETLRIENEMIAKCEKDGYFRDPERTTPDHMDLETYQTITHSVQEIEKFFEEEKKKRQERAKQDHIIDIHDDDEDNKAAAEVIGDIISKEKERARCERSNVIRYVDGETAKIKKAIADNKGYMDVIMMCGRKDLVHNPEPDQTIRKAIKESRDKNHGEQVIAHQPGVAAAAVDKPIEQSSVNKAYIDAIMMWGEKDLVHNSEPDQTIRKALREARDKNRGEQAIRKVIKEFKDKNQTDETGGRWCTEIGGRRCTDDGSDQTIPKQPGVDNVKDILNDPEMWSAGYVIKKKTTNSEEYDAQMKEFNEEKRKRYMIDMLERDQTDETGGRWCTDDGSDQTIRKNCSKEEYVAQLKKEIQISNEEKRKRFMIAINKISMFERDQTDETVGK